MKTTEKKIELLGTSALTRNQAEALFKAALAVMRRHDLTDDDDTITDKEYQRLSEAVRKLEFVLS